MLYSTQEVFDGILDNKKAYRFHYLPSSTPFAKSIRLKPVLCMVRDDTPIGSSYIRKKAYTVNKYGTVSEKGKDVCLYDYFADNYNDAVRKYNNLVNDGVSMFNNIAEDLKKERIS